jgi:hypothetical protein
MEDQGGPRNFPMPPPTITSKRSFVPIAHHLPKRHESLRLSLWTGVIHWQSHVRYIVLSRTIENPPHSDNNLCAANIFSLMYNWISLSDPLIDMPYLKNISHSTSRTCGIACSWRVSTSLRLCSSTLSLVGNCDTTSEVNGGPNVVAGYF